MKRIKITKEYQEYKKGEIIEVSNNVAFGLIDKGVAKIFKSPANKMMSPGTRRRYKYKIK